MKGRTTEKKPHSLKTVLGKHVQLDSVWWPGEKTEAENKQISQCLQDEGILLLSRHWESARLSPQEVSTAMTPLWVFHGILEARFHRIS